MKTNKFVLTALSILVLSTQAHAGPADFATPDENQPGCARNPSELQRNPQTLAIVNSFGGLQQVIGTWKISGIPFANNKISFSADANNFRVQADNDFPEEVSLCAVMSKNGEPILRIAVHTPACPENKNIYARAVGPGVMSVRAYGTRAVGSAKFKRKSPTPLPPGPAKPGTAKCARF